MSNDLDFDKLSKLFKTDPEKFEEFRKREIEKVIQSAPERTQKRLRGIQFQVDAKREIHKNAPYKACMEISNMMHDSFDELRNYLNELSGKTEYVNYNQPTQTRECAVAGDSKVISFRR